MTDFPIDIVIPWVDDSDPNWRKKRDFFLKKEKAGIASENQQQRFRDWGTLRFLLRSIEEFVPWVHQVFILTDDQMPEWMNGKNVKIIDHKQFIKKDYLPTFNSNAIELNVPYVPGLSEHFILMNDDFLFVAMTSRTDFFTPEGQAVDVMGQSVLMPRDNFAHIAVNNISLINQTFSKKEWLKANWGKALSYKNGVELAVLSILLTPFPYFTRFFDPHIGVPYTKKTFLEALVLYNDAVKVVMNNKFRASTDISHWVVRYYQILTGNVYPHSYKFGKYLTINDTQVVKKLLKNPGKVKSIALNDKVVTKEDEHSAEETMHVLGKYFNRKSFYER